MPAPLPKFMRNRFERLIREGLSRRAASRRLQMSEATGLRGVRQIRTGAAATVTPIGRPSGAGKLAAHERIFRKLVTQDPDITLFELHNAPA